MSFRDKNNEIKVGAEEQWTALKPVFHPDAKREKKLTKKHL